MTFAIDRKEVESILRQQKAHGEFAQTSAKPSIEVFQSDVFLSQLHRYIHVSNVDVSDMETETFQMLLREAQSTEIYYGVDAKGNVTGCIKALLNSAEEAEIFSSQLNVMGKTTIFPFNNELFEKERKKLLYMSYGQDFLENRSLYVCNIPQGSTVPQIRQQFPGCLDVILPQSANNRHKGYCYVNFKNGLEMKKAALERKDVYLQGQKLKVMKYMASDDDEMITDEVDEPLPMSDERRFTVLRELVTMREALSNQDVCAWLKQTNNHASAVKWVSKSNNLIHRDDAARLKGKLQWSQFTVETVKAKMLLESKRGTTENDAATSLRSALERLRERGNSAKKAKTARTKPPQKQQQQQTEAAAEKSLPTLMSLPGFERESPTSSKQKKTDSAVLEAIEHARNQLAQHRDHEQEQQQQFEQHHRRGYEEFQQEENGMELGQQPQFGASGGLTLAQELDLRFGPGLGYAHQIDLPPIEDNRRNTFDYSEPPAKKPMFDDEFTPGPRGHGSRQGNYFNGSGQNGAFKNQQQQQRQLSQRSFGKKSSNDVTSSASPGGQNVAKDDVSRKMAVTTKNVDFGDGVEINAVEGEDEDAEFCRNALESWSQQNGGMLEQCGEPNVVFQQLRQLMEHQEFRQMLSILNNLAEAGVQPEQLADFEQQFGMFAGNMDLGAAAQSTGADVIVEADDEEWEGGYRDQLLAKTKQLNSVLQNVRGTRK